MPQPTHSKRLDIDIWFNAQGISRPDVDNIIKPILDAFKGIVYFDDNQVRSVRVVALSSGDAYKLRGSYKTLKRLINSDTKEFLINIYNDLKISGVLK
ncbi:MAG: RusA family crossover junction endodeoxyribonuclease [Candidatus Omnitrophica bacterium]|nr:RusA family crossover junction endodeoxyribonuclease [Candidatus Omnitrophota bacterium]